jgi:hypothetical protein
MEQSLFDGPPEIPENITGLLLYKLQFKDYMSRLKSTIWLFIEAIAVLLVLGIIWINVEWVKIVITAIAIASAIILFMILHRILY